jgi:hypothetical protein
MRQPPKPTVPAPVFNAIPDDLTQLAQWVLWRYDWKSDPKKAEGGKWDKPPFNARTGGLASTTNAATWSTFEATTTAFRRGGCDGIGFVLSEYDPFAGLDLDDGFVTASDEPTDQAREYLELLSTYTERSPSGKGFRAFVKGALPPGGRKKGDAEVYESGRYLTVTGNRLMEFPATVETRQAELEELHRRIWPIPEPRPQASKGSASAGFTGDDAALLEKMYQAKNSAKVRALYEGSLAGYESASNADFALCSCLAFWTGPDPARLDRLFRGSGLMREKWDARHYSDGSTYGKKTVERAIARCPEFYTKPQDAKNWNSPMSPTDETDETGAAPSFEGTPGSLEAELFPVEVLTPDMIPSALRRWLLDMAERLSCPLEYVSIPAVVALGAVIGRQVGIRPKQLDDWLEYPNLWGAIVGKPGALKTPSIAEVSRLLNGMETEGRVQYEIALENFNVTQVIAKARAEAAKDKVKKLAKLEKPSDKEKEDLHEAALETMGGDSKVGAPTPPRWVVNDPSIEKLGELLRENPNGLLLLRDELTGFLRMLDKQGHETDRAFYLEAWNGKGSFTWDRVTRGTVVIPALCMSVIGTIQPGPLSRYLRESSLENGDDGFASRFQLMVWPDPVPYRLVDRPRDAEARKRVEQVFKQLARFTGEASGETVESDHTTYLRFDPEAQALFFGWLEGLEHRMRGSGESPLMETHLSKYRKLIPALALIFHLVERVEVAEPVGPVSLVALEQALAWAKLLETHARRIYQAVGEGSSEAGILLSARVRKSLPNPFTAREVRRRCWSGLTGADEIEGAIAYLEDRNWVKSVEQPSGAAGGRPTVVVYIHPDLRP